MTEWRAAALCARIPDWPARERDAESRGGDYSEMVAVCQGCGVRTVRDAADPEPQPGTERPADTKEHS